VPPQRVRHVAGSVVAPPAAETDLTETYPRDNAALLRDTGLMSYTILREYGRTSSSVRDATIIIEEFARVCDVAGRIAVQANMSANSAVMEHGADAQKRLLLTSCCKVTSGELHHRAGRWLSGPVAASADPFSDSLLAAEAKIFASEMAIRVTNDARKMFGECRYSRDCPMECATRGCSPFAAAQHWWCEILSPARCWDRRCRSGDGHTRTLRAVSARRRVG
jgi:alkylation response protein AidB-like acyl-CoA dehydrogenase